MLMGLAIVMIPIVAILTKHQQKMAMILRQGELDRHNGMSHETDQLREMVRDQTLAIEQMRTELREVKQLMAVPPPAPVSRQESVLLQERL